MEITIRIPNVMAALARRWRWTLLALPMLAVAIATVMFTLAGPTARPAEAALDVTVTIVKLDRATGQPVQVPGACFNIEEFEPVTKSQFLRGTVCDNDFPPGTVSDTDPTFGTIKAVVATGFFPPIIHVTETNPPLGYNLKPGKNECIFVDLINCTAILENDPKISSTPTSTPTTTPTPTPAKGEININPEQKAPGPPPFGCYSVVLDSSQEKLFVVCDNDAQAGFPQQSPVCLPASFCTDTDPLKGRIRVSVLPAKYNVVEFKAPPFYDPTNSGELNCNVTQITKCELTFLNESLNNAWFPFDVNGDGSVPVVDLFAVAGAFGLTKP